MFALDPDLKTSYAHQFSGGVDRVVGQTTMSATVAYVRGLHQLGTIDYNPLVPDLERAAARRISTDAPAVRLDSAVHLVR